MTDAPKHNLALMKLSTYHKERGDEVFLGNPQDPCDLSYGSWLFRECYFTNISGGPGSSRPWDKLDNYNGASVARPDYSLFPIDYSLGYTWEYCPRDCGFCVVPKQKLTKGHMPISWFHDPKFTKIRLLNNNTFTDPYWRETFQEIWDSDLTLLDEGGYDLRLLDREKIWYLNRTRFEGLVHFAWDKIEDEAKIQEGLSILKELNHSLQIYVLVGFPDRRPIDETDIYRCQVIADAGFDPFVMVHDRIRNSKEPIMRMLNRFQRLVNRTFIWRRLGFEQAWVEYKFNR